MLDSDQKEDRLLFLKRLRELTAVQIEQQIADQQQAWKLLLEEENRATIERIAACRIPRVFETELTSNTPKALRRHRTN
jgi:hypothetical protein